MPQHCISEHSLEKLFEADDGRTLYAARNIDEARRNSVCDLVETSFAQLNGQSILRQSSTREELEEEIDNVNVIKLLLEQRSVTSAPVIGYMAIHTCLDDIDWLQRDGRYEVFGDADRNGLFFYNSTFAIDESHRSLGNAMTFLSVGTELVTTIAESNGGLPVIGFDYCRKNDPRIPQIMSVNLRSARAHLEIETLCRHNWFYVGLQGLSTEYTEIDPYSFDMVEASKRIGSDVALGEADVLMENEIEQRFLELDNGVVFLEQITPENKLFSDRVREANTCSWHLRGLNKANLENTDELHRIASLLYEQVGPTDTMYIDIDSKRSPLVLALQERIRQLVDFEVELGLVDYHMYSIVRG